MVGSFRIQLQCWQTTLFCRVTVALTGPRPTTLDFRNRAARGSVSNALFIDSEDERRA